MSYFKIKRRPADTLFSNYIRQRAKWTCEYCGKVCRIGGEWIYKLEASHYYGRAKESVRFDPDNVHSLCFNCHKRMGGHTRDEKGEYDVWMKKLLGQKKYDLLAFRANGVGKKDDKMTILYIKELIKTLGNYPLTTGK